MLAARVEQLAAFLRCAEAAKVLQTSIDRNPRIIQWSVGGPFVFFFCVIDLSVDELLIVFFFKCFCLVFPF